METGLGADKSVERGVDARKEYDAERQGQFVSAALLLRGVPAYPEKQTGSRPWGDRDRCGRYGRYTQSWSG